MNQEFIYLFTVQMPANASAKKSNNDPECHQLTNLVSIGFIMFTMTVRYYQSHALTSIR